MHFILSKLGCVLFLVACAAPVAFSQSEKDKTEIAAIVQGETDAWNRGDAEGFAAHYSENGSFTNVIGQQLHGRKAFIEQHARISAPYTREATTPFRSPISTSSGPMSR